MRALQLVEWKKDPEFRTVPDPEPGPGQVVIEVAGAGACHSDLHLMEFEAGMVPFEVPFTLGHENAGWVQAMGEGVEGLEVGEPVAVYGPWGCGHCRPCLLGAEDYCEKAPEIGAAGGGLGFDGGMAPLMLIPHARHLVPLDDLDPVEAAPLTDAGLTPYHAVKRSLSLLVPGSTAVVIGVGGLGHMGVQLLRALSPARIVAIDQRESALAMAREVGADETFVSGADTVEQVRALTRGVGAEVVIDFVGAEATIAMAVAMSRPLGHVTMVGIAGGSFPFSFFSIPYEVSLATTYWGTLPELVELLALAEAGKVKAHVTRYSLDDAMDAYGAMRAGTLDGRAVIVP